MNSTGQRRSRSKLLLIICAAIVVVALLAAMGIWAFSGDDASDETPTAEPSITTPAEPPATESNGQSGFGTPSADYLGRAVLQPNNPVGEPRGELRPAPEDACAPEESGTAAADVAIEGTKPVTLWSAEDGPSRVDSGAPVEYSQSPRGAALAVWNYYMVLQRNDDAAKWVLDNRTDVPDDKRAQLEEAAKSGPVDPDAAALDQIAPAGYRVMSCDRDYVVLDIAREVLIDGNGKKLPEPEYSALRFGAVWTGGDWHIQLQPMETSPGPVKNLDGWAQWEF